MLGDGLPQTRLVAVDLSTVVLASGRARLNGDATIRVCWLCPDFHYPPIREGLMVAAFLPVQLSATRRRRRGMARCLAPGGIAALVTESFDRYRAPRSSLSGSRGEVIL